MTLIIDSWKKLSILASAIPFLHCAAYFHCLLLHFAGFSYISCVHSVCMSAIVLRMFSVHVFLTTRFDAMCRYNIHILSVSWVHFSMTMLAVYRQNNIHAQYSDHSDGKKTTTKKYVCISILKSTKTIQSVSVFLALERVRSLSLSHTISASIYIWNSKYIGQIQCDLLWFFSP